MQSSIRIILVVLFTVCCCDLSAEVDRRDTIVKRDGKTIRAYIKDERVGELVYSSKQEGGSEQTVPWSDVKDFSYHIMSTSLWEGPSQAVYNGDYDTAVKQFAGLGGVIEEDGAWKDHEMAADLSIWKRAYGLFYLGKTLEEMGKRKQAASVFARLAELYPEHRLSMYAVFREGVNSALSGGDASKALEAIKKYTTTAAASIAGDLEKALDVMNDVAKGEFKRADRSSMRLRSRFRDNFDDWMYWRETWAEVLMANEEGDKALMVYKEMHEKDRVVALPRLRGHTALMLARALKKLGRADDALYYFLQLDVLPFVGVTDLAAARFEAAKIYINRLKSMEDGDEKNRIRKLCEDLLQAVVDHGPAGNEMLVDAQLLIDEHFSDEDDDADAAEGDAEAADGDAEKEE